MDLPEPTGQSRHFVSTGGLTWPSGGVLALAAGTLGCAALAVAQPGEFAAALLAWVTFLPLILTPGLRSDPRVAGAYFLVVMAHHGLSLANVYLATLPGAEYDALWFHTQTASMVINDEKFFVGVGTDAYIGLLGAVYHAAGVSLLLGQQLSVLVFAGSCLALIGLMQRLGLRGGGVQSVTILLYGLAPSVLLYGSLTMREPFQILFCMVGCLAAVEAWGSRSWRVLTLSWFSFLAMGVFHEAMLLAAVILTAMATALFCLGRPVKAHSRRIWAAAIAVVAMVAAGFPVLKYAPALRGNSYLNLNQPNVAKNIGKIGSKIVQYRGDIERLEPRTSYGFTVRADTATELWTGLARSWGHYLFGPPPGPVRSTAEAVLVIEALLRWIGLASMVVVLFHSKLRSPPSWFLAGGYLLITAIWSIGTTNYGQAFRHHVVTTWILLLFAFTMSRLRQPRAGHGGDASTR